MDIVIFLLSVVFVLSFFSAIKAIKTEKSSLIFEIITALSFAVVVWGMMALLSRK